MLLLRTFTGRDIHSQCLAAPSALRLGVEQLRRRHLSLPLQSDNLLCSDISLESILDRRGEALQGREKQLMGIDSSLTLPHTSKAVPAAANRVARPAFLHESPSFLRAWKITPATTNRLRIKCQPNTLATCMRKQRLMQDNRGTDV